MAPAVLWVDEIEKGFASGGEADGGVSARLLGTFLRWMQDRPDGVFLVATANDVSALPPEFLRKGRFDEVFFVDLPGPEARRAVFEIQLAARGHDPARFDQAALARATDGFSGQRSRRSWSAPSTGPSLPRRTSLPPTCWPRPPRWCRCRQPSGRSPPCAPGRRSRPAD